MHSAIEKDKYFCPIGSVLEAQVGKLQVLDDYSGKVMSVVYASSRVILESTLPSVRCQRS